MNITDQKLENRLLEMVQRHERELLALKTPQKNAGSTLQISKLPTNQPMLTAGPGNIAGGSAAYFSASVDNHSSSNASPITLYDVAFTVYVDALDDAHAFPFGSALTNAQSNLQIGGPWFDLKSSSRTSSQRGIIFQIKNNDTAAHNYYVQMILFSPYVTNDITAGS